MPSRSRRGALNFPWRHVCGVSVWVWMDDAGRPSGSSSLSWRRVASYVSLLMVSWARVAGRGSGVAAGCQWPVGSSRRPGSRSRSWGQVAPRELGTRVGYLWELILDTHIFTPHIRHPLLILPFGINLTPYEFSYFSLLILPFGNNFTSSSDSFFLLLIHPPGNNFFLQELKSFTHTFYSSYSLLAIILLLTGAQTHSFTPYTSFWQWFYFLRKLIPPFWY